MVSRQATIETLHDLEEEERGEGEGGEESEKNNKKKEEKGESFLEEARHRPPPEGNVDWGPHSSADSHLFIPRDGR